VTNGEPRLSESFSSQKPLLQTPFIAATNKTKLLSNQSQLTTCARGTLVKAAAEPISAAEIASFIVKQLNNSQVPTKL